MGENQQPVGNLYLLKKSNKTRKMEHTHFILQDTMNPLNNNFRETTKDPVP